MKILIINHMKMLCLKGTIVLFLLLYPTPIQAQTTNIKLELTESVISSPHQNQIPSFHKINQTVWLNLTSHGYKPWFTKLPYGFNGIKKQSYPIERLDTSESNYDISEITKEDPIKTHRKISGISLAVSYTAPIMVDLLAFPQDSYKGYLFIPVIGPFIHLGKAGKNYYWSQALRDLLIVDGIAQTAFATYFVVSLTRPIKPHETKKITLASSLNSMTFKIQF